MGLRDYWVTPGMTTVRPCQGRFYQHSSGSNVFYDDFGYCTPQYEGAPAAAPTIIQQASTNWILIGAIILGGYLVWHYRKKLKSWL